MPCSGLKLHARRVRQQIDRAVPIAVDSSLIGDESNALPGQRSEALRFKHIDPGKRMCDGRSLRCSGSRNLDPQMNTDRH